MRIVPKVSRLKHRHAMRTSSLSERLALHDTNLLGQPSLTLRMFSLGIDLQLSRCRLLSNLTEELQAFACFRIH